MRALFSAIALSVVVFAPSAQAVHFTPPVYLHRTAHAVSVAVADIDHDGALDVVAAVPDGIEIFYGDMRGGVRETEMVPIPARALSIALSDINQDGTADIIANTRDGVYNILSAERHYGAALPAGKADVAVTKRFTINGAAGTVTMDGRSKALFVQIGNELERTIELSDVVTSFAIADFDGDGNADIAASTLGSNRISILHGDGSGGFAATDSVDAGEVALAIAAGDIDRNGHIDLVVAYAKGIGFIPNITARQFDPPTPPSRTVHAQSLHPAPEFLPAAPCTIFFTFLGGFDWDQPFNWRDTNNQQRLPNGNDTACIQDSPGMAGVIFVNGSFGVGSVQSTYHPGIQINGSLSLNDGAHSSRFQNVTVAGGSLTSSGPITIGSQVDAGSITLLFNGSMFIVGPNDGSDAMTVFGSAHWESGSVRAINGPIRFWNDSQVFGQLQLCESTTLVLQSGTTMSLNGVIIPCSTGFGTINMVDSTISGNGDDNAGIYVNITTSTANGPVKPMLVSTGTGPFIIGNHFLSNAVETLNARLSVGAGTTIELGGNVAADVLSSDGQGTTVFSGNIHGILTPINNPLNISGGAKLFAAPGDRADFTTANGPVTLGGSIIGHFLQINGAGSQLDQPCVAGGATVELHGTMTSNSVGSIIDGTCAPGSGVFRVSFSGGVLNLTTTSASNPGVEFENQGTVNVQAGTFTIWDSPIKEGSAGGHFNLAAGAKLLLNHEYKLNSAVVSGDGFLETGAPLHAAGATIQNLSSSGDIDGSFTITGNWLYNNGTISNGFDTLAAGATMTGGPNGGRFDNSAFMNINGTANLLSACVSNNSTFSVNYGGTANISPPFGTIALGECGPPSGGKLNVNTRGTLVVNVTGRSAMALPSTFNGGNLHVTGNGPLTFLSPSTFFSGFPPEVLVDGGSAIDFQQPVTFSSLQATGGGTISFSLTTLTGSPIFFGVSTIFNNATYVSGNMTLGFGTHSVPTTLFIQGGTVSVNGTLDLGTTGHMTNNGTIFVGGQLNVSSPGHAIVGSGSISNSRLITGGSPIGTSIDIPITNSTFGRIVANSGSLTTFNLTNISGGTLTGGSYEADGGSTLNLGGVQNNAASLTANGGTLSLSGFSSNMPNGNITLVNGGLISGTSFTNNGTVSIGAHSTFSAFSYTQASGQTTMTDPTAGITAQTILQGGLLAGYGTISGNLQNLGGDLQPNINSNFNNHPGTMIVAGNYSEGAASHLHMVINGTTNYSQLRVTGSVSLAGTLQIDPATFDDLEGDQSFFFPNPGDSFKVLTFLSRSGNFANIVGQDLTFLQDFLYTPHFNANDLTFVVETQDPKVQIANLETTIGQMGLDSGVVSSLKAKLDAALSSLQMGNATAACGQLGAALNYVSAQTGKKLTQDQADSISAAIQKIRAKVGCS